MIGKEIIGKERGKVRVRKLSNVHCLQKNSHDVHHVIPVPTSTDGQTGKFNVVLDDVLVVGHFQMVYPILGIASRVDRAKLNTESEDKRRPIIHPLRNSIGIEDRWFEVLKCGSA